MRTPFASLLLFASTLASCTMGTIVTNGKASIVPAPVDKAAVPALASGSPVAIVAGSARDDWYVLVPNCPDQLKANLKVWSDEAAVAFARDLATVGGKVDASSSKRVEVTVTSASGESGVVKNRVNVTVQVRTGGQSASFNGSTSSMKGLIFCSEDAMRQAIEAALKDANVRSYVQ